VSDSPSKPTPDVKVFSEALYKQVMDVMGVKHPSFTSRCLSIVFAYPINRLSRLLVNVDRSTAQNGWSFATREVMDSYLADVELHGNEYIPQTGPLLVVANHPAAYDFVVLSAAMKRDDLKILASDVPIVKMLPNVSEHFIPVPYEIPSRLQTVRKVIQQLSEGGAVLIFPRGNVEPDPAISPGAEDSLLGWSPSIELFLRRVPQTLSVMAIVSGMLSERWYKNPLFGVWKKYEQRQKVAEIFQVATQLFTGKKPRLIARVNFSVPLTVDDLGGESAPEKAILRSLLQQARELLSKHPYR
jgi:hypothetical protein